MGQLTTIQNTQTMSSLDVAKLTEKRHDNVISDIKSLLVYYQSIYSTEKSGELVKSSTYKDSSGKSNRCYLLSKDAALDLVTGYSLPHRHAVNQRWQELERSYSKQPQSKLDWIRHALKVEEEREAALLEVGKLNTLIDNEFGYCSILRAAKFLDVHETTFKWQALKARALQLSLPPKKVPSPRYGYQNIYPIQAFKDCYPEHDFDDLTPELVDDKNNLIVN